MQNNGFKKSLFGLNGKQVTEYLDTLSSDIEKKLKMKDDDIKSYKKQVADKEALIDELSEKLEQAENALEAQKEEFENEKEELKKAHNLEISELKIEFNRELAELNEKMSSLRQETEHERDKISSAILNAENTAKNIIEEAKAKGNDILDEAQKKVENEKQKFNKTKADLSDFTYDVKRLLDKLNSDIKDKLKSDK